MDKGFQKKKPENSGFLVFKNAPVITFILKFTR